MFIEYKLIFQIRRLKFDPITWYQSKDQGLESQKYHVDREIVEVQ